MEKLKQFLKEKGWTQAMFCEKSEIDAGALCRMLQGKTTPSLENALKIKKATRGRVKPEDWVDE